MTSCAKFRTLNRKVKDVSILYIMAKRYLTISNHNKEKYIDYIEKVTLSISMLDGNEQDLLKRDFFEISDPYWWERIYSRSTYYRYKKSAMTKFLKYFNYE